MSSGTRPTHPMDRQVVRRYDVTMLRERSQIDPSSSPQEQIDHSTAFLADEMIMLAGLGVESSCLLSQEERADFALLYETVKVAIDRGEADSRQLLVHPPVDLMSKRVAVIALESFEYLFQLTCSTYAGSPSHRLPRIPAIGRIGSSVSGCGISSRQPPVKWFSGYLSSPASGMQRFPIVRIIKPGGQSPAPGPRISAHRPPGRKGRPGSTVRPGPTRCRPRRRWRR
jgi:hypothetical protein